MTLLAENPRAVIGANNPPEPTPFELAEAKVNDAYGECALWLDGAKVETQEVADGIGNLLALIRDARKIADANRVIEKKPHDDAAKAAQERYKPLLDKADLATAACKKALEPWLVRKAAEQEAIARAAREEAERRRREADDALRASDAANLEARAAAEALQKSAKQAETVANKASRQTATAGGAIGRAVSLRTVYSAVMVDAILAARFYWQTAQPEMRELLQSLADRDVRAGKRDIPGFDVIETKTTV